MNSQEFSFIIDGIQEEDKAETYLDYLLDAQRSMGNLELEVARLEMDIKQQEMAIRSLDAEIKDQNHTIYRLKEDNRKREEQDNWRKVTGLRGF